MTAVASSQFERVRVELQGAVQGVGFRPAVYRLAGRMQLSGWVRNTVDGLELEVEGDAHRIKAFLRELQMEKPSAAVIATEAIIKVAPRGGFGFEILESLVVKPIGEPRVAAILPDLATCRQCVAEIFDPANRRFGYAFTNCTECGPRHSIVTDIPYDRHHTTMHAFQLCPLCRREYDSHADRRFHAQPNACAACGPRVWLSPAEPGMDGVFAQVAAALLKGQIVALKGIGGFQLLVDARNPAAVRRLREKKQREHKPFAVMMPSVECVHRYCELDGEEEGLLRSAAAPIVLLLTKDTGDLAAEVAQHTSCLGVMLPYSGLHHLLMTHFPFPVVATSGNVAGEPVAINNGAALACLKGVADMFVLHNRPIARRSDDSVVRVIDGPQILRRARGYAPLPIVVPRPLRPVLAVGGHLKSTVAIGFGKQVRLSQHIGDLTSPETRDAFEQAIDDLYRLYRFVPEVIACDLHPDYASTQWAKKHARSLGVPLIQVQHHQAHVASCAADHGLCAPYLGVAWDGAGFGTDGRIWGGEFFVAEGSTLERVASLRTFALPGGEAAMRDCSRPAAGVLWGALGASAAREAIDPPLAAILELEVNAPQCSSVGRLFDAVAYLAGAAQRNDFEGQAAMCLECAVRQTETDETYTLDAVNGIGDWSTLINDIQSDRTRGVAIGLISAKFHNSLANWILTIARSTKIHNVVLSGGVFQNRYLTRRTRQVLEADGFEVFTHRQVPANDGGLAIGQAVLAGTIHKGEAHVPRSAWKDC